MAYAQDHAGVRVVGTVLSTREAMEQTYDVLLIDDTTSYLTKRLIDRVHLMNRLVVGVYEGERSDFGREKLLDLGADAVIEAGASPKEFMARIRHVTDQRLVDRDFAGIVAAEPEPTVQVPLASSAETVLSPPSRSVTVVSGSGGVTEVSLALATALARSGQPVVLVDFDTIEPTLAQRLAVGLTPNVLTAVESLRHKGSIDGRTARHPAGFELVVGLPSPREWEACTPDDAADLVGELARVYTHAVVRVNRHLEDLSPFGVRSGRFGVARRIVADADNLVVVGDPSPTGVTALLAWIGDARVLSGAPVHVVLNHCGRSLYQRGEITEEIGRTFRSASVAFAPEDSRVRKAAWQGELPPNGRYMRSLEEIVGSIAIPAVVVEEAQ
jgi:MinD-like ATPase involved in chromosome partitioning or flagellar assembly